MKFYKKDKSNKGFTIIELLVVITIFTVITTALVIQQNKWNDRLQLNTKLYDLALYIRQAQFYSLSVRQDAASVGDTFDRSYGVHFDAATPNSFVFFSDRNKNQRYEVGENLNIYNFTNGITIDRFCGFNPGGSLERCAPDSGNVQTLDILFYRPESKAIIVLLNNGGGTSASANPPAKIYLKNSQDNKASVTIQQNGQISINENDDDD